jgi:hypothetical protein
MRGSATFNTLKHRGLHQGREKQSTCTAPCSSEWMMVALGGVRLRLELAMRNSNPLEPVPPSDDIDPYEPNAEDIRFQATRRYVFISHTTVDAPTIRKVIVPILDENGVQFHLANRSDVPQASSPYRKAILRSLSRCKYFIAFVSHSSVVSQWVKFEVQWASIHRDPNYCLVMVGDDAEPTDLNPWLAKVHVVHASADVGLAISKWDLSE